MILTELTNDPINVQKYQDLMHMEEAGAVVSFLGTTRNHFDQDGITKQVVELSYEAYEPMALKTMQEIASATKEQFGLLGVCVVHRLGIVPVKQDSILVVCTSAHRKAAIQAMEQIMDKLKEKVPIWKKEIYTDGSSWKQNAESFQ
jgi:molybdopterin synthase catalytic subunit